MLQIKKYLRIKCQCLHFVYVTSIIRCIRYFRKPIIIEMKQFKNVKTTITSVPIKYLYYL